MSKFIPVDPEKWAEILTSEMRLKGRVIALEAELESEKAAHKALRSLSFTTAVPSEEYEKLKDECERTGDLVVKMSDKIHELKAEVERLEGNLCGWQSVVMGQDSKLKCRDDEIEKLKAENARLKGEDHVHTELGSLVPRHLVEYWMSEAKRLKAEVERLKAYVEHLENAGWLMEKALRDTGGVYHRGIADRWNAAKDGKPSA